jgi:hypothetical protein
MAKNNIRDLEPKTANDNIAAEGGERAARAAADA